MSLVLVHGTQEAGHPRRPHRRPVRQAALGRHRDARRRHAAELPRRPRQPRRVHGRGPRRPIPQLMLRGYERAGADAQLHPRARRRRLRRPAPPGVLGPRRSSSDSPHADAVRAHRRSRSASRSTSSSAISRRRGRGAAPRRLLHEPRGARSCPTSRRRRASVPRRAGWYNLSTHFPWIGMRTAQLDGAHVEFFRGIANPIGIKVGPAMTRRVAASACSSALDPERRARPDHADPPHGRRARSTQQLPPLVEAVRATGRTVLWVCDPMHGNTETTPQGIKTRRFDNILGELEQRFELHARARLAARRRALRAHRRGRHRVHRRRARPHRGRPRARVQDAASIRASTTSRRSRWRCASPSTCERSRHDRARRTFRRQAGPRLGTGCKLGRAADDGRRLLRADLDERGRRQRRAVGGRRLRTRARLLDSRSAS